MDTVERDELRQLFRHLYYLKADDHLAKGNLSQVIREMKRHGLPLEPGQLRYAEENIGQGANHSGAEKEVFRDFREELLAAIRFRLTELGDSSWVERFDS